MNGRGADARPAPGPPPARCSGRGPWAGRKKLDIGGAGYRGLWRHASRRCNGLQRDLQRPRYRCVRWPRSRTPTLENGLPLYRIPIAGTRAVTILVAFDAGARSEHPEENGMAHFLEHLVFKGGEKYPTYRDVNQAAEGIGAVLNAYTSHDLVAFHITARAERALDAADLLTDFVGRPRNRRRGARPRARRRRPGDRARQRPAGGDGRAPDRSRRRSAITRSGARCSGPPSTSATRSRGRGSSSSGHGAGRPARGGAFLVGNLEQLGNGTVEELFGRFPAQPEPEPAEPAPPRAARARDRARLQPVAPADVLPAGARRRRPAPARRARDLLDAARRLDGLAPVRRDPRAARPRLLGALDRPRLRRRAGAPALGGLESEQDDRGVPHGCGRS